MGSTVCIARVRKHGLRVLCLLCGREYRHKYERRLRFKRSPCCSAHLLPAWHVAKDERGVPLHPREYGRARLAFYEERKERQEPLPGV